MVTSVACLAAAARAAVTATSRLSAWVTSLPGTPSFVAAQPQKSSPTTTVTGAIPEPTDTLPTRASLAHVRPIRPPPARAPRGRPRGWTGGGSPVQRRLLDVALDPLGDQVAD